MVFGVIIPLLNHKISNKKKSKSITQTKQANPYSETQKREQKLIKIIKLN